MNYSSPSIESFKSAHEMSEVEETRQKSNSISHNDFEQFQTQLIELRTSNYQLEEGCEKLKQENEGLKAKIKLLEEEQQKSGKMRALFKSGKSKDEINFQENQQELEHLRQSFEQQESQFHLQTTTLKSEVSRLIDENSVLEEKCLRLSSETNLNENQSDTSRLTSELHEKDLLIKSQIEQLSLLENDLKCAIDQQQQIKEKNSSLKDELSKTKEIVRQKDSRCQDLSSEKEKMFSDYKKSLDDVSKRKDAEIKKLADDISDFRNQLKGIDTVGELQDTWEAERSTLLKEIEYAKSANHATQSEFESLQIRLQETISAGDMLAQQLQTAKLDVENMNKSVAEAESVAEQRKVLVDNMASHVEKLNTTHQTEFSALKTELTSKIEMLEADVESKNNDSVTANLLSAQIEEYKTNQHNFDSQKMELVEKIQTLESSLKETVIECEQRVVEIKQEEEKKLGNYLGEFEASKLDLESNIQMLRLETQNFSDQLDRMNQQLKDKDELQKVVEKKHMAVAKDLKRQVQTERRRTEKLQEKMQDALGASPAPKSPPGGDGGSRHGTPNPGERLKVHHGDTGSVSSWGMVSNGHDRILSLTPEPGASMDREGSICSVTTQIEQENEDLIRRIANLQRQKWECDEKNHALTQDGVRLREVLAQKSAIIENYVRDKTIFHESSPNLDSRGSVSGQFRSMIKNVVKTENVDVKETNKKLQLMLEETLTKNMHLEKAVELLSQENALLTSKIEGR